MPWASIFLLAMLLTLGQIESLAAAMLERAGQPASRSNSVSWACAWLEACGYPGLKLLGEAVGDSAREQSFARDGLGIDLCNVSCAWFASELVDDVKANGRVFLRNVRHGLYLVPFAVKANMAIGCPVDPAFALGGVREKNPYDEKLALAAASGVNVDDTVLESIKQG
jgi:hypothetical protein